MKVSTKTHPSGFSSQLDELFGRPTLLNGEDRGGYRELRKAVEELMSPQDLFDAIDVQEVVDSIWDAQRFRKHATKLVNAERDNAIKFLASSIYGYVSEAQDDWFGSIAGKPYPDGMTEAEVLKKGGLSVELVQARAVLLAQEDFSVLDRLVANRIAIRKAALRDYARRKRLAEKDKRLSAKAERQHLANDNRPQKIRRRIESSL